jgi:phage/plasmid-like protein (TIGR03299 family)
VSHEIETTDDGRATFVAVREHGWHQLGTLVDHDISVSDGLELAHLKDRNYRTEPLIAVTGTAEAPHLISAAPYRAIVRDNPFTNEPEVLGAGVTDSFTIHTPEAAFGFGEDVIEQGHPLAALGSIKGGRRAFAAFRLDGLTIGGVDQINTYLNVMTDFTGTMSTVVRVSAIRVVCSNTFNAVMGEGTMPTYKVRHIGAGLEERVDDARAALGIGWKALEEFQAEADLLIDREITNREFQAIVEALITVPKDATDLVTARREADREAVRAIYNGPTVDNIKGTAWGALNAYTEWADWRGGNFRTPENRMVAQITPGSPIDSRRDRAGRIVAKALALV